MRIRVERVLKKDEPAVVLGEFDNIFDAYEVAANHVTQGDVMFIVELAPTYVAAIPFWNITTVFDISSV